MREVGLELREEFFDDGAVFGDERIDAATEAGAVFVGEIFRRDDDDRSVDEARVATDIAMRDRDPPWARNKRRSRCGE
jgi:hypothetical protein